jgi:hypothetical protein
MKNALYWARPHHTPGACGLSVRLRSGSHGDRFEHGSAFNASIPNLDDGLSRPGS